MPYFSDCYMIFTTSTKAAAGTNLLASLQLKPIEITLLKKSHIN
ncbi:MAG: hypothetical protein PHR06_14245 [Candidatus Cloacimonetes bacterium]|nr:hypothetical protein [Candidatus Cloacimonadota bacterium]